MRPQKDYKALAGGTDLLLTEQFLTPGGNSFRVGPEEKTAWVVMNNSDPRHEDFKFCKVYGEALRAALRNNDLQEEGLPSSNYWTYTGDSEAVRRLALQAAMETGMTLDPAFLARLSTVHVNQLQHMVTVYFRTAV